MDVQSAQIDPESLLGYIDNTQAPLASCAEIDKLYEMIKSSSRPVIVAGRGVRLAGAQNLLKTLATEFCIPVVTPYLGIDNLRHDQDVYIGKTGVKGDRPGNFAMQNSDLILAVGTSLHISVIGYDYEKFARVAKKVVIDIDLTSHRKRTIKIDLLIESDAKEALQRLIERLRNNKFKTRSVDWLQRCVEWKKKYPVCLPEYSKTVGVINIYTFMDCLSNLAGEGDAFIGDAGSALYGVSQGIKLLHNNQRYIPSCAMATMGYTVPASIGVSLALGGRRVLAITGDGSLQPNIQELQTILYYNLPVKLFIWNNDGYLSIRAAQNNYFEKRYIGEGPRSGVTIPDTLKICDAYGIKAARVREVSELKNAIQAALDYPGPYLLEVMTPPDQPIIPSVSSRVNPDGSMSSRPLEDMAPFLPREEYLSNLLIDEA